MVPPHAETLTPPKRQGNEPDKDIQPRLSKRKYNRRGSKTPAMLISSWGFPNRSSQDSKDVTKRPDAFVSHPTSPFSFHESDDHMRMSLNEVRKGKPVEFELDKDNREAPVIVQHGSDSDLSSTMGSLALTVQCDGIGNESAVAVHSLSMFRHSQESQAGFYAGKRLEVTPRGHPCPSEPF